jgi:riboflavin kinase / FMN adenylyltransferase
VKPEAFLPWLQRSLPHLAALYVGENFRFGCGRAGDVPMLNEMGRRQGIRIFSSPRVNLDAEPISSTRIRRLLAAGEMASANACLGYHYCAEGVVVPGRRLGHTLGFPTLNLVWAPGLKPRCGVYAVRVSGGREKKGRPAVANFGVRPTVEDGSEPRLEVHVLGECPWGEGDLLHVEWLTFLRPETKFPGLDQLRAQIAQDLLAVEQYFHR